MGGDGWSATTSPWIETKHEHEHALAVSSVVEGNGVEC